MTRGRAIKIVVVNSSVEVQRAPRERGVDYTYMLSSLNSGILVVDFLDKSLPSVASHTNATGASLCEMNKEQGEQARPPQKTMFT
ncbi:hypothetical protein TNCV_1153481 [Trichonephila clavipes]|nr:hypothetical protein TNCV_1153481 [Trichonephila clavipes]